MAKKKKKKNRAPKQEGGSQDSPRESKKVEAKAGKTAVLKKRTSANWVLLSPAVAGMALAAYMTSTGWAGAELAFGVDGGGGGGELFIFFVDCQACAGCRAGWMANGLVAG